jgi:two-component system KDP operon response regulator KdpE
MLPDRSRGWTLLIIEDDSDIRGVVGKALEQDAGQVLQAATGAEGIDLAAAAQPDLVILDLGLPDARGIEVCREIRKWSAASILVLSARHGDRDKVELLDAGADDFVTKPFSVPELRARVRACLRRADATVAAGRLLRRGPVAIGELELDLGARTLKQNGLAIHLTPIEWDLLRVLVTHAGRTLTHPQLFAAIWGPETATTRQQHLRVHLANLRRKIERDAMRPRLIVTEPGVGYRFEMPG